MSATPSTPGSFALLGIGVLGPGEGVRRVAVPSLKISSAGVVITELGAFPGETTFSSDQTGVAPFPLGPDTHVAALGDRFVVGTAETEEYRRYAPDGGLEQLVRWPPSDTILTESDRSAWESFLGDWLGAMPRQEAASIQEILDVIPDPARRPAYSGLVTSDAGEVWVGDYHPGQLELGSAYMGRLPVPERKWLVFDQNGTLESTVRTPDGFRPFTVENGKVWGVHTDDLDVESVRAYEIVR